MTNVIRHAGARSAHLTLSYGEEELTVEVTDDGRGKNGSSGGGNGLPGIDGLEATRRIGADPDLQAVRVIMLTTFDLDEHVFEALGLGAAGFLVKDTEPTELLRGVRVVASGDALLTPNITRRLIAEFASQRPRSGPSPAELEELTDREREVVGLVARGLSNDEIAETLVISPRRPRRCCWRSSPAATATSTS